MKVMRKKKKNEKEAIVVVVGMDGGVEKMQGVI